jgi:hypothetical protein
MSSIITIPTPCHEDWSKMSPNEQGRHCGSCVKTVVDFTTWQPQAILQHFETNKNVCGRFTVDQLDEPIPTAEDFVKQIVYFKIPTLKKIAAIFLFAFMIGGSSCTENTLGGKALKNDSLKIETTQLPVTTPKPDYLVGEAVPEQVLIDDSIKKSKEEQKNQHLIGDTIIHKQNISMGAPAVSIEKNKKSACVANNNTRVGEPEIIESSIKKDTHKEIVIGRIARPISK